MIHIWTLKSMFFLSKECKNTHVLTHTHTIVFVSSYLAGENAVETVTRWGYNHGDYKLVILWSPDWWTFGGCVPSCHMSPDTHTHTHTDYYTNLHIKWEYYRNNCIYSEYGKNDNAHLSRRRWWHVSWGLGRIKQVWIIFLFWSISWKKKKKKKKDR